MEITVEFAGGLEQLVKGEPHSLLLTFSESSSEVRLFHVVSLVARRLVRAKAELFVAAYTPEDAAVYAQLQKHQEEANALDVVEPKENEEGKAIYSTADLLQGCMAVRGGVLALVNEVDSEVLQGADTPVKPGDTVTFISTLHGG
ncbi:hypothetical protein ACSSS7_003712 [Eimeria intestinalis]